MRSRNLTARNTTVAIWSSTKHAIAAEAEIAAAADAAAMAVAAEIAEAAADAAVTAAAVEIAVEAAADAAAIVGKLKSNQEFESGKFELIDFPLFMF